MTWRSAARFVVFAALAGCARSADPPVSAPPAARFGEADERGRPHVRGPERPRTFESRDFDVGDLPSLEPVALDDLPEAARGAARLTLASDRIALPGFEALDLEFASFRFFAIDGQSPSEMPIGANALPKQRTPAVWRGPARREEGRLRFICFEGTYDPWTGAAEATSAFQVIAQPIVADLVYAFRSGHPESGSTRPPTRHRSSLVKGPDRCQGSDSVEIIGPTALWVSSSEPNTHDASALACPVSLHCPFSRVAAPIERGSLSVALIVTDDSGRRARFPDAPTDANVFSYTFELDWTHGGTSPSGRVFIGAEVAPIEEIGPSSGSDTVYAF
ncbi:MAG: hypothetical protein U0414_37395 [Polyangiaceae bacterium]